MAGGEGFTVTLDELHAVAKEIQDIAERTRQNSDAFGDAQQGITGQARGFAMMVSAAECGAVWKVAVQTQVANVSVNGDMLGLTADAYRQGELDVAFSFRGR